MKAQATHISSATNSIPQTSDSVNGNIQFSSRAGRILNNDEYARLQSEWNNYLYRGYKYVQRSNGGIVVDFDNALVYTDGDGEPEYVLDVIDTDREINNDIIQTAMKLEREGVDHETQRIVLESLYGKGSARFRTRGKRKSTSGKNRAGTGRNAGSMGQGNHGQVPEQEVRQYSVTKIKDITGPMRAKYSNELQYPGQGDILMDNVPQPDDSVNRNVQLSPAPLPTR